MLVSDRPLIRQRDRASRKLRSLVGRAAVTCGCRSLISRCKCAARRDHTCLENLLTCQRAMQLSRAISLPSIDRLVCRTNTEHIAMTNSWGSFRVCSG